jgi:hypothetical protein
VDTVDSWEVCGSRLILQDFRGVLQLLLLLLLSLLQMALC